MGLFQTKKIQSLIIFIIVLVAILWIFQDNYLNVFLKLLFSVSFIYILGLLWLGTLIGWDKPIFKLGAQPFLLAELFKLTLLTILYPWLIKINFKLFG